MFSIIDDNSCKHLIRFIPSLWLVSADMDHQDNSMLSNIQREVAYQLRTVGSRCFPGSIRPPYPKERLAELLSIDPIRNERDALPEGEVIDLCSMWVTEFYTPAYMDELLNSLEQLGWNKEDGLRRNLVGALMDSGSNQFGTRWIHLGRIMSSDAPDNYLSKPLSAHLPAQVRYAQGDIFCFTPSLIALTIEFVFDEEYRWAFQEALRQYRKSYVTPNETGRYRIHAPENQRIDHIEKIRMDAKKVVSDWIANNVPGVFSAGLLQGDFPTCEFVTLSNATPFPLRTELDDTNIGYLRHLGLLGSFSAWESTKYPGLRLNPSGRSKVLKHHAILSIKESNWIERDSNGDEQSRESRMYWLNMAMSGILSLRAILSLLQGYAGHFKELRTSALLGYPGDGQVEDALRGISENLSFSVDISAVTSELMSYVDRKFPLGFDIETFTPCEEWPGNEPKTSLGGNIHYQIGESARWLQAMESSLRDQMTQFGSLLGMLEDIRLQKRIKYFTYVLTFLTVVLAALTVVSVFDIQIQWSGINEFITGIGNLPWS